METVVIFRVGEIKLAEEGERLLASLTAQFFILGDALESKPSWFTTNLMKQIGRIITKKIVGRI